MTSKLDVFKECWWEKYFVEAPRSQEWSSWINRRSTTGVCIKAASNKFEKHHLKLPWYWHTSTPTLTSYNIATIGEEGWIISERLLAMLVRDRLHEHENSNLKIVWSQYLVGIHANHVWGLEEVVDGPKRLGRVATSPWGILFSHMTGEAESEHFEAPLIYRDDLIAVSNCFLMKYMLRIDVWYRIR